MFVAAVSPRASAEGQETHGVYHTQFENDSIRLVRVRYPANSKVPLHGHPPTVTTYVYLSGSSPVRFTHQGSRTHVVTRQPTTPGGFRVSRGGDETHSAENLGAIASDFLRVEFKTDAAGASAPFYRDARPLGTTAKTTTDVQFSNAQMRITRVAIPAGQITEIATTTNAPALLIALGEATMTADGTALPMQIGQERWVASSRRERLANVGASQIELLRIDVLISAAVLEPAIAQQPAPARSPETVPTPITLPPALDRVLRDYERAWRDGNGTGVAALFTDDGFAVQSGSPLRQGRAAIAQGITRPSGAVCPGPRPSALSPHAKRLAHRHDLAHVIRHVIGREQDRAKVGLTRRARRHRRRQVVNLPGHVLQPLSRPQAGRDAVFPRGIVGRRGRRRPVVVRPRQVVLVGGVHAEVEDVVLRDADVLQQLPRRVLEAGRAHASRLRRHAGHGLVEADVCVLPVEDPHQMVADGIIGLAHG